MPTTASCWRECTRCFCFASPSNFAFTWATGITVYINSCPVKCGRTAAAPDLAGDKNCEPADQWRQPGWHLFGHARTSGTCAHPVQSVVRNERRQSGRTATPKCMVRMLTGGQGYFWSSQCGSEKEN